MSARLMVRALELDLPEGLKLTLIALARYAADDGTRVWPKIETLVGQLGKDRRTVERRLARLRALGILQVEATGGGRHRASRYRLDVAVTPAPAPGVGATETPAPASRNPGAAVAKPRHQRRETPAPAPGPSEWSRKKSESRQGGGARATNGSDPTTAEAPETPAIAWLAAHHAVVRPTGNGFHRQLMDDSERLGSAAVVDALEAAWAAGNRTAKTLVFAATDYLNPVRKAGSVEKREREEEQRRARDAALARTAALRREREEWEADEPVGAAGGPR